MNNEGHPHSLGSGFSIDIKASAIISLFKQKYSSKIIFALSTLGFSSYWELSKHFGLKDMTCLRASISQMESMNIIVRVEEKDEDYQLIREFWKYEHPTCPNLSQKIRKNTLAGNREQKDRFTTLFRLSDQFFPVVKQYYQILLKRFISPVELKYALAKRKRFEVFYDKHKDRPLHYSRQCAECGKALYTSEIICWITDEYAICADCKRHPIQEGLRKRVMVLREKRELERQEKEDGVEKREVGTRLPSCGPITSRII